MASSTASSLSAVELLAQLRREHFSSAIPEFVAKAVAEHHRDDFDAAVADAVAQEMAAAVAAAEEDRQRIAQLSAELNAQADAFRPIVEEREALELKVAELQQQLDAATERAREAAAAAAAADDGDGLDTAADARSASARAVDDERAALAQAQEQLRSTTQQLQAATEQIANLHGSLRVAESQLAESAQTREHAVTEALEAQAAELRKALDERDHAVFDAEEKSVELEVLRARLATSVAERDAQATTLRENEVKISALEQRCLSLADTAQRNSGGGTAMAGSTTKDAAASRELGSACDDVNSSARAEVLAFWRDGHDRIESLERELAAANSRLDAALTSAARADELASQRPRLVASIAALTSELESAREEQQRLATVIASLQAEAEALQSHLAAALHAEMSGEEIAACATRFREAARRQASEQGIVAHDPAAIRAAALELQALKHEISDLTRQKRDHEATIASQRECLAAIQVTAGIRRLEKASTASSSASAATGDAATAAAAAAGLTPAVIAKVAEVLHDSLVAGSATGSSSDDWKLKRLGDLQLLAQTKRDLSACKVELEAATLEKNQAVNELKEHLDRASDVSTRSLDALEHCRGELNAARAREQGLLAEVQQLRTAASAREKSVTTMQTVVSVLASQTDEICRALAAVRRQNFQTQIALTEANRTHAAKLKQALAEVDDSVLAPQLRAHLELLTAEHQRRLRRDALDDASARAKLRRQLEAKAAALAEASGRLKDVAQAAAGSHAAKEESAAWCASMERAMQQLQSELRAAVNAAASTVASAPADMASSIERAAAAGAAAFAQSVRRAGGANTAAGMDDASSQPPPAPKRHQPESSSTATTSSAATGPTPAAGPDRQPDGAAAQKFDTEETERPDDDEEEEDEFSRMLGSSVLQSATDLIRDATASGGAAAAEAPNSPSEPA